MDARQMSAMVEATRLTRAGRLAEATALIQRTLTTSDATCQAPDAPCAEEQAGGAAARHPALLSLLPGHGKTRRGQAPSSWTRHLRTFPSQRVPDLGFTHAPAAPAAKRSPGRFDAFSYTGAAGTRTYRLYVPASSAGEPLPLVVLLHGGTQDAATFAAATGMNELAERHSFLVAYPEQSSSANPGKYWNWFVPGHQRRNAGEPSLIAGITGEVMGRRPVTANRVYVAGFSAGGAMAAVMGAVYPDLYAAVGVHSGLPYAVARDMATAFRAMKQGPPGPVQAPAIPLPLIVFHGDQDMTVSHANATFLIDQVVAARNSGRGPGVTPTVVTSGGQVPGGHAYTRTSHLDSAGVTLAECWTIHHGGHTWSGGVPNGSYTDPRGPSASAELIRFFDEHPGEVPAH
jgi:poly(hydroxyalkanoate) depolymerase family esterase